MDKKIASLLSICMKAGKITAGGFSCEKLLQNGHAKLILLASDASENTKKKFEHKTFYYQIPLYVYGSKSDLSHSVGKQDAAVYAVTDEGLADNLRKWFQENLRPQSIMEADEWQK